MKKLILAMVLILTLTFVFVGCNKDKETTEPTTTEKVSTTEPTTKFEAPEIKDEPTTEETTEETTETTTKKPVYSYNSGSSNSGSGNSGSSSKPSSKPATTKAPATTKNNSHLTDDSITPLVTNSSGGGIFLIGDGKGDELKEEDIGSADDWEPDPEMDGWGEGGMLE